MNPEFKGVTFLQVSFDDQKDVLKKFNVANQSTIIVFKGGKEVGRSVGDTKYMSIDALAKKSLGSSWVSGRLFLPLAPEFCRPFSMRHSNLTDCDWLALNSIVMDRLPLL